jgi:alcohol dehydrogenase (cytochrome c)
MSPAYSPDTGYFYLETLEGCGIHIKSSETFRPGGFQFNGTGLVDIAYEEWQTYVRALDLTTGKQIWEYKLIGSHQYGAGVLSTAGGVLFAGSPSGSFIALDAKSGKPLWNFNTGQTISASPMTYSFEGKQYVTVEAGADVVTFGLFE